MSDLSAYLMEREGLAPADLATRLSSVGEAIKDWLREKGAPDANAERGEFTSLTKSGAGKFERARTTASVGSLEEVSLEELSRGGQVFNTSITTATGASTLSIYVRLAASNTQSLIAPVHTDPRCPSVVRKLLGLFSDWSINGDQIGGAAPRSFVGEAGALSLVEHLRSSTRVLPTIVVSEYEGEVLWPKLDGEAAFDLAGLAHVAKIDDEASWVLSDSIGKINSCYRGAVRLYWPLRQDREGNDRFAGTVWTATSLLSNDQDGRGLLRFRSALRRKVMSVAALSIVAPPAIAAIRHESSQSRLRELEARANSNTEELELARLFISENEALKAQLVDAKSQIASLSARAEIAEYALEQLKGQPTPPVELKPEADSESEPKAGETRFYKKTHSKPSHDVLLEVADCGHTSWQSAAKAEKAKKGVERLVGRGDWKSIQHCGSCTGGGMWKVRW